MNALCILNFGLELLRRSKKKIVKKVNYSSKNTPIYVIDPVPPIVENYEVTFIKSKAQDGTERLIKMLTD